MNNERVKNKVIQILIDYIIGHPPQAIMVNISLWLDLQVLNQMLQLRGEMFLTQLDNPR